MSHSPSNERILILYNDSGETLLVRGNKGKGGNFEAGNEIIKPGDIPKHYREQGFTKCQVVKPENLEEALQNIKWQLHMKKRPPQETETSWLNRCLDDRDGKDKGRE